MKEYSILINTCDKFEDCWDPFFKLFSIYWPDFRGTIYLNTEYKDYSYDGLEIIALKVCEKHKIPKSQRATWSQCLKWALEEMEDEIVLYMQEDYFLNRKINNNLFEEYLKFLTNSKSIHCVHLTNKSAKGINLFKDENLNLYSISRIDRDRISCQAALWKKEVLKAYLRTHENGWNFEWWGSKRAAVLNHFFCTTNNENNSDLQKNIIAYEVTGVIGGKWYPGVVPLFTKHEIQMDYSIRGFFLVRKQTLKERLDAKLKRVPIEIRSSLDLLKLKLS